MKIGIVSEGKTDFVVIETLLNEWSADYGLELEILTLQPQIDESSGLWGDGGWSQVMLWCRDNPPEVRNGAIFGKLFEHEIPFDLIFVHLDADVIEEFVPHLSRTVMPDNIHDGRARYDFVLSVLDEWLWPNAARSNDLNERKHLLLPAVRATESWLLAGMDTNIESPKDFDPEVEMMNKFPNLITMKKGRQRLRKNYQKWAVMAKNISIEKEHLLEKFQAINTIHSILE